MRPRPSPRCGGGSQGALHPVKQDSITNMMNRRRRRCIWWTPWSTTPSSATSGALVNNNRDIMWRRPSSPRSEEYFYVANERTSSPTIDREGLFNGKATSILSLHGLTSTRALGQGQDPLCSCTFILQNGVKLCANESRPRRAARLQPVCALGSSSYIRPKRCSTERTRGS